MAPFNCYPLISSPSSATLTSPSNETDEGLMHERLLDEGLLDEILFADELFANGLFDERTVWWNDRLMKVLFEKGLFVRGLFDGLFDIRKQNVMS